jgi:hypothetical protein
MGQDKFKKGAGSPKTQTIEFTVGPDIREVHDAGVEALDAALKKAGTGELMHLLDPRRINAFSSGGPSTWSVAFVPVGEDHLFITYGNSDRIDPARAGVGLNCPSTFRPAAPASGPGCSFGSWCAICS